jgi:hypothetical protein
MRKIKGKINSYGERLEQNKAGKKIYLLAMF